MLTAYSAYAVITSRRQLCEQPYATQRTSNRFYHGLPYAVVMGLLPTRALSFDVKKRLHGTALLVLAYIATSSFSFAVKELC